MFSEDNVAEVISNERFAKMSRNYEQEQGEISVKIKKLKTELKKVGGKQMTAESFLDTVRRHTNAQELTKRMVTELIDHIVVFHAEKSDGITNQKIIIYYNCIGEFQVPDWDKIPDYDIIMETRKGVAISYAPLEKAG